jgi:hypothetical protein
VCWLSCRYRYRKRGRESESDRESERERERGRSADSQPSALQLVYTQGTDFLRIYARVFGLWAEWTLRQGGSAPNLCQSRTGVEVDQKIWSDRVRDRVGDRKVENPQELVGRGHRRRTP